MSDILDKAIALRGLIEKSAQYLPEDELDGAESLFPAWQPGQNYEPGFKVNYNGTVYKVLQQHESADHWKPDEAVSLYAKLLTSEGKVLPWVQPDSVNPYQKGDKVEFEGQIWQSDVDNNVWKPGEYGWSKLT